MEDMMRAPYGSLSELTASVNRVYVGSKPLSPANVRNALEEISGYRLWRLLLKGSKRILPTEKLQWLLSSIP